MIIAKKYGIFKIQKAINLYKLHIILLLEIAKKLVNPAIKLELKKGRLECKALIFFTNNFKLLEEKCLEYTIIDRSLHG